MTKIFARGRYSAAAAIVENTVTRAVRHSPKSDAYGFVSSTVPVSKKGKRTGKKTRARIPLYKRELLAVGTARLNI
eukprot:scaffold36738_cov175-Skeletonema_marinoi.AAC.1